MTWPESPFASARSPVGRTNVLAPFNRIWASPSPESLKLVSYKIGGGSFVV